MKTIAVIFSVILLTGCAALEKFDQVEYSLLNTITTSSELAKENCSNKEKLVPQVDALYISTVEFKNYVIHFPKNVYLHNPATELAKIVKELHISVKDPAMTVKYCEIKLDVIKTIGSSTQQVAATKGK